MIIFFGLFLIIIAISFVLASNSMKDFQEIPSPEKNSLYLIQNPAALTADLIKHLQDKLSGEIVSLERLFKGTQSALVIFGPKLVLESFSELNLLELEDYTNAESKLAWEMGIKGDSLGDVGNIFEGIPVLNTDEQFWWQLVLQPQKQDWQAQIRAVLLANTSRQKELSIKLQKLSKLVKIPKPQTSEQIYNAFVVRSYTESNAVLKVTKEDVLKLLGRVQDSSSSS